MIILYGGQKVTDPEKFLKRQKAELAAGGYKGTEGYAYRTTQERLREYEDQISKDTGAVPPEPQAGGFAPGEPCRDERV
jgi:hypothetical protein